MRIYKVYLIWDGAVRDYCACASLPIANHFATIIDIETCIAITEGPSCHIYSLSEVWKWVQIFEEKFDALYRDTD